jgi:hypothetical protein
MPRRSKTKGNHKGRAQIRNVKALSLSEAEEMALAKRKDQTILRGKQIYNLALSGGYGSAQLAPSTFGLRVGTILTAYERWKILKLVVRPLNDISAGLTSEVVAINDDGDLSGTALTQSQLLEYRCSRVLGTSGTDTNEFQWNPIDIDKWYYTSIESSGGDIRLVAPCVLIANATPTSLTSSPFVLYYTIVAEGAKDVSAPV